MVQRQLRICLLALLNLAISQPQLFRKMRMSPGLTVNQQDLLPRNLMRPFRHHPAVPPQVQHCHLHRKLGR